MTPRLRHMIGPTVAFSMLICVSCGSSPAEVVAIEVDNSVPISISSSTVAPPAPSKTTVTTVLPNDVSTSTSIALPVETLPVVTQAPVSIAPTTEVPTTQPPATQAPVTQPPAPSDPIGLRIEPEYVGGYNRDLFADWYDADRNGCNTRKEVLIAESLDPVQIGSSCSIIGGRWFLIAVTASSNRSKSDRDPAEWMPPNANYHCEYVRIWIEIKRAWDLSVDQAEHDYLAQKLASC